MTDRQTGKRKRTFSRGAVMGERVRARTKAIKTNSRITTRLVCGGAVCGTHAFLKCNPIALAKQR